MNTFVDMDALLAKQGELFESVQLKKPSLAETFHIDASKSIFEEVQMSGEIPKFERAS